MAVGQFLLDKNQHEMQKNYLCGSERECELNDRRNHPEDRRLNRLPIGPADDGVEGAIGQDTVVPYVVHV